MEGGGRGGGEGELVEGGVKKEFSGRIKLFVMNEVMRSGDGSS